MKHLTYPLSAVIAFLCVMSFLYCSVTITPEEMTYSNLMGTAINIGRYGRENQTVPPSLSDVPSRPGFYDSTLDGWDRPLLYEVSADGVVTLSSLGRDGKPGGSGANADLVKSFRTRKADGTFWMDSEYWMTEAEIRPPPTASAKVVVITRPLPAPYQSSR